MSIRNSCLIILLLYVANFAGAQDYLDLPVNQRVILNFTESVVYAEVLTSESKFEADDDLVYYWFSANDIKHSRGGFDGKLLHGEFTEFFPNKNLKQKGNFRFGLKDGEWKTWYLNGELKEISDWKKGKPHGKYKVFNEQGSLIEKGSYSLGFKHGKIYCYENGVCRIQKYKDGEIKEKKKVLLPFLSKGRKNKKGRVPLDENEQPAPVEKPKKDKSSKKKKNESTETPLPSPEESKKEKKKK